MEKFNSKIAAGVLAGLGLVYMVVSLATGRSAQAEPPPDLAVDESKPGIDVFQTADLLIREPANAAVVDVRSSDKYGLYHLPGSQNEPGAAPSRIAQLASGKKIVLVASKDEEAVALATAARSSSGQNNVFYLKGGARSFYLTFELPVPLFSDKDIPFGYREALATVKTHLKNNKGDAKKTSDALATLVRLNFQPTALKSTGKPKASGGKRKKIAGGCG